MLLSIIVPIYNVEQYIEECLYSLYNQDISIEEYEIICVNDCSPDRSVDIVKRMQKIYSNLTLIEHTENKRQGGARNTGLKHAQGEYIWFVDSDDFIMPNVLSVLLNNARMYSLDILQFDYIRGSGKHDIKKIYNDQIQTGEEYLFNEISEDWYEKINGPWHQLIRKELLINNNIKYIENIQYEDTDFMLSVFLSATKVQYMPICAYNYRVNENSVTMSEISPIKLAWRINQIIRCVKFVDITKSNQGKTQIIKMISNTLSIIRIEVKKLSFVEKIKYINNISSDLRRCKVYMTWRTWLAIKYGITIFI